MQRDLIFFVNGIPEKMKLLDEHFFFAPVEKDISDELRKLGDDFTHWLRKSGGKFHAFVLRNNVENEDDAVTDAFDKLSGILDGYTFLTEEIVPEPWPVVQVREKNNLDAKIKFFGFQAWARLNSKDGVAKKNWETRTMQLLNRLLPFFDEVSVNDVASRTELADQIVLSAKMFRHGGMARSYGVNFLCKFSSLEGLVCGSEKYGHGKLLEERLSQLFRHRGNIKTEVRELWGMRCEASHQGKAFSNDFPKSITLLENLVLGTVVFAIDHLKTLKTIDELWKNAASYISPAEAIMERPPEIRRLAALQLIGSANLKWTNVGLLVDKGFDSIKTQRAALGKSTS